MIAIELEIPKPHPTFELENVLRNLVECTEEKDKKEFSGTVADDLMLRDDQCMGTDGSQIIKIDQHNSRFQLQVDKSKLPAQD